MGGEVGNVVTLVGFIESLGPPFDDQMPDDRFEFTMVLNLPIQRLGSLGSVLHFVSTDGTLELYKDMLKNADWLYPETFADGRKILTATLPSVEILQIWMPYSDDYGKILGTVTYTGGLLFDRVSENGVGETGEFGGLWYLVDEAFCPLNYFGSFDIAMTLGEELPPIAVANTTWGRIKKAAR